MTVEVLFFAQLREALGIDRKTVVIDDGKTVSDVVEKLGNLPHWTDIASLPLRVAVNEEIVDGDYVLRHGDRLALLTPVSGG